MASRSQQLQVRVTPEQKAELKRLAASAGQPVSEYVLSRALPQGRVRFASIIRALRVGEDQRYALAELNDLLAGLTRDQLQDSVAVAPLELWDLGPRPQNLVAAMVEQAAHQKGAVSPPWVRHVTPLESPHFTTPLRGLRLHLLRAAPVPFKRRNIFVDSGVGDRV